MKQKDFSVDKNFLLGAALAFALPYIAILIGYSLKEIAPFGERTICSMDGFSQYYPMLENMAQALKDGEPFFSFNGNLGFNLWAQSGYYTNSPFWLILYLVPHSAQLAVINLMSALKLAFASLFFYVRLSSIYGDRGTVKSGLVFPVISACYGLSGYSLAFINQLMWTDVIMLLPLVIMGLEALYSKGRGRLYCLSLFLCMWSCFYLSFMVCIFLCLYFIYIALKSSDGISLIIKKGLSFTGVSLISAGLSAVVLIPVYKAISLTAASELGFEGELHFKHSLKEMLLHLLPFREPSLEYGAPNMYFGTACILLLVFALLSKKISLKNKLLGGSFLLFMFLSMSLNLGDYIWHGLHYPNQLPGRQSFLFIFLALSLTAAFVAVSNMRAWLMNIIAFLITTELCINCFGQLASNVWASKESSLRRYDSELAVFSVLENEEEFMRIEWADVNKNNYPQQYTYKGITYYSSTMSAASYNFYQQLGIPRYAKNVSVYYYQSEITNALFGIKYLLNGEQAALSRNDNALPLGFMVSPGAAELELYSYAPGEESQQALWRSITGQEHIDVPSQAQKLREQSLEITFFDTDVIKGHITALEQGIMLTSIGYEPGWEFFVDSEKAEIIPVGGYLSGIRLGEGTHEIELRYTVPGIRAGGAISLVSLAAAVFILIRQYGAKRKKPC